jgi:hypothetical protein
MNVYETKMLNRTKKISKQTKPKYNSSTKNNIHHYSIIISKILKIFE